MPMFLAAIALVSPTAAFIAAIGGFIPWLAFWGTISISLGILSTMESWA